MWTEFSEPTSVLCDTCHTLICCKKTGYYNPETKEKKCKKCWDKK